MFRRPSPLLTASALLALAWAQVFGLTRGYLCECHGSSQITAWSHCHEGETDCCRDQPTPAHSHETHDEENDPAHEHQPVKASTDAQTPSTVSAPASVVASAWGVLVDSLAPHPASFWAETASKLPSCRSQDVRRWQRVLTRAVALRI